MTRDELKEIATKNNVDFVKNISTENLRKLLVEKGVIKMEKEPKKKKMSKPEDGKKIKCVIRNVDPNYKMDVCEVGVNGYFLSIPLDKEVEISEFWIPTIKATKYDKAILDDNGQVKEIRMTNRFAIEVI